MFLRTSIFLLISLVGIAAGSWKKTAYCTDGLEKYTKLCENPHLSEMLRKTIKSYCEEFKTQCYEKKKKPEPKKVEKEKPKPTKKPKAKSPEAEFKKCCQNNQKLVDSCKYMCSFRNLHRDKFLDAFFRNTCPGRAARHVINCASFGVDHRQCCRKKGVHRHAGGMCMPFCNPTMRGHIGMGIDKLPCLDVFPQISQCFQQGMPRN